MASTHRQSFLQRLYLKLGSMTTGITLLILVGVAAAAGTFILQRPLTDPEKMAQVYSPQALAWLDRLGLTDVYHVWWFALLMAMLGVSIIFASLERWPKAWRMVARPYRRPEPHFRAVLPIQAHLPVNNASQALMAAESAFRKAGLKPARVVQNEEVSLYAQRNLLSVFSVYVVHTSLLLILIGGIVDAFFGYHGYVTLTKGQSTDQVELKTGVNKKLPFTLRCDGAGQENYSDGSPKKWWSDLVVLENGQETQHKQIVVNDPLVTHGIRFYQAGYGSTGQLESVKLGVRGASGEIRQAEFKPDIPVQLDAETSVTLAHFIPDVVVRDGQIYTRSNEPNNPAFDLEVNKAGATETVWLVPSMAPSTQAKQSGYTFQIRAWDDIKLANYTGLQVSHEPGQWAVWTGVVLMALGLVLAFYLVHQRYWAITYEDASSGQLTLWVGTAADKNREHFQERFNEMVDDIRKELGDTAARHSEMPTAVQV